MSRPEPIAVTACQVRELRDPARIITQAAELAADGFAVVLDAGQILAVVEAYRALANDVFVFDRE